MVRNCALAARGGMAVTMTQKIVLIALLVLGGLCLIVGFTLMHHIGGFLHTVEEEARERDEEEERAARTGQGPGSDSPET